MILPAADRRVFFAIHAGLLALALAAWGYGLFEPFELRLLDHRFRARGAREGNPAVAVVGITQSCIEYFGGYPLKRSVYADFISRLRGAGVAAIGLDLVFDGPSTGEEDERFARAVTQGGVVLTEVIQSRETFEGGELRREKAVIGPHAPFAPAGQPTGYINTAYENVNIDGILRALPLRETVGGRVHDSFALALLRAFRSAPAGAARPSADPDRIPPDRFHYIHYYSGANQGIEWIPLSHFFDGQLDADQLAAFRGRIVVLGPMAPALGDLHHTPFGTVPGVEVHATILSNALDRSFLRRPGLPPLLLVGLALAGAMAHLACRAPLPAYAGFAAAAAALHAGASYLLFFRAGIALEILPVLAFALFAVILSAFYRFHLSLYFSNVTLRRKIEELKALYEISKTISDIENLDSVLRRVLAIAVEVLESTRGSLMLFDEERERLRIEVMYRHGETPPGEAEKPVEAKADEDDAPVVPSLVDLSGAGTAAEEDVPAAPRATDGTPSGPPATIEFAPGEGVAGVVFEGRKPVIVNRGSRDPRFKAKQARDADIESLLCVPMMLKDRCIGVINVSNKRDASPFTDSDAELMEMVSHHAATVVENARLYKLATVDGMTGLYVHRYFKIRMREEFLRAIRYRKHISVILTDIDHFKKFNDTYGHQIGDLVLASVAGVLRDAVRMSDFPARYGGEEFIVILPETESEGALKLAERIRERVEARTLRTAKGDLSVTLSAGVATFPDSAARTAEELISFADAALYKAKATGRNRTCLYG